MATASDTVHELERELHALTLQCAALATRIERLRETLASEPQASSARARRGRPACALRKQLTENPSLTRELEIIATACTTVEVMGPDHYAEHETIEHELIGRTRRASDLIATCALDAGPFQPGLDAEDLALLKPLIAVTPRRSALVEVRAGAARRSVALSQWRAQPELIVAAVSAAAEGTRRSGKTSVIQGA